MKAQEPVEPEAVNVQVTGDHDAGVAVTVIEAPEVKPERSNVGVSIFVILSELELPESEAACSTGAFGAAIVVVKLVLETVEVFPELSFTTR